MTVRVAVVDDQTLFAETLRTALNTDPGVDVVAVLSSGAEFLKTVSSTAVDVALIDVDMPGMSGLETVRALADIPQAAAVQVVMLTVFTSPGVVRAALDARVAGFLGKNVHTRELLRAIRTAADGGRVVTPNWPQQPLSSVRIPSRRLNDGYCAAPRAVLTRNQSPPNCS